MVTTFACAAVLFDLDGVLVDSRQTVEMIWEVWAAERGVDLATILAGSHGERTYDTIVRVAPHLDPAAETALIDARELVALDGLRLHEGAARLAGGLPAGTWAVVTSCSRALATARLDHVGLAPPPVLITADDVARGKPDPEGYRLAAGRLGAAPQDCLVIEDAHPGIAAGRAAGMRVLALATTHAAATLRGADAVAAGLWEVGLGDGWAVRVELLPPD